MKIIVLFKSLNFLKTHRGGGLLAGFRDRGGVGGGGRGGTWGGRAGESW